MNEFNISYFHFIIGSSIRISIIVFLTFTTTTTNNTVVC